MGTPARPIAAITRPQLASSPNRAVLTKLEVPIVWATCLACPAVFCPGDVNLDDFGDAFAVSANRQGQRLAGFR